VKWALDHTVSNPAQAQSSAAMGAAIVHDRDTTIAIPPDHKGSSEPGPRDRGIFELS
jgi:hypothetical protein